MQRVPTRRLTARRQQLQHELARLGPVLRPSVIERFTQCGKGNCKCMRGEKHGPACYLAVSYAKGRTRQVHISKTWRPVAETWAQNYQRALAVLEEVSSIDLELLRRKAPDAESPTMAGRGRWPPRHPPRWLGQRGPRRRARA